MPCCVAGFATVDEVERRTGFDFFSKLPAAEQSRLESAAEWSDWK